MANEKMDFVMEKEGLKLSKDLSMKENLRKVK